MAEGEIVELAGQLEAEVGTHKWEEGLGKNEDAAIKVLEPSAALGTLMLRSEEPVQHIKAGENLIASLQKMLADPQVANSMAEIDLLTDRTVDKNIAKLLKALANL